MNSTLLCVESALMCVQGTLFVWRVIVPLHGTVGDESPSEFSKLEGLGRLMSCVSFSDAKL